MGYPPSGRMTGPVRRRLGATSRRTGTRPPLRHVPGRIPPRFIPPRRFFLQEPRSPEVSIWVPLHRTQHPWNPHGATLTGMTMKVILTDSKSVLYRILHLSANRRSCSSLPWRSLDSVTIAAATLNGAKRHSKKGHFSGNDLFLYTRAHAFLIIILYAYVEEIQKLL